MDSKKWIFTNNLNNNMYRNGLEYIYSGTLNFKLFKISLVYYS